MCRPHVIVVIGVIDTCPILFTRWSPDRDCLHSFTLSDWARPLLTQNYSCSRPFYQSEICSCCRPYYLLIQARKSFRELLVTAIVDTPPEEEDVLVRRGPGFVIQRMGEPNA